MRHLMILLVLACLSIQPAAAGKRTQLLPPRVSVQTLAARPSSTPQRFRVTLLIDNLNTEPLVIRAIEFKLRLADEGILDGNNVVPLTVDALGQQSLTLDMHSDLVSSLSRLMAFVRGPDNSLSYDIYGKLTLDRRSKGEMPFAFSGEVPLTTIAER
jgi:LEA14-like dessication related protein